MRFQGRLVSLNDAMIRGIADLPEIPTLAAVFDEWCAEVDAELTKITEPVSVVLMHDDARLPIGRVTPAEAQRGIRPLLDRYWTASAGTDQPPQETP